VKAPKTIIFWGQSIFSARGRRHLQDLPDAEIHRLDAGHFAVEDHLDYIANNIIRFYDTKVATPAGASAAK
jgi:hypothetical protein